MIWASADLHLGHRAAIDMCRRPFKDINEMNKVLIGNINSMVSKRDTLYLLGDVSYRIPTSEADELISQINGKKILLLGNHDKRNYDPRLFEDIRDFIEIGHNGVRVSMMHYPMMSWPKSHYGSVHLHGHIHSTGEYNLQMREQGIRRYDVGVDANGFCPVSLDNVFRFMGLVA